MLLTFWQTHKVFFKTFAICFAIMFLALSFAPPLSSDAHAIALVDDGIFLIIISLLAACGITISASSAQTALEWVEDAVNDFCTSVGSAWDTVKSGFSVGVNKLGDILANNSLLTWFSDFVTWLKNSLSLQNNTVTPIVTPFSPPVSVPFVYPFSVANIISSGLLFSSAGEYLATNQDSFSVYCFLYTLQSTKLLCVVSDFSVSFGLTGGSTLVTNSLSSLDSSTSLYYRSLSISTLNKDFYIPLYDSLESGLSASRSFIDNPSSPSADYVNAGVGTLDIPVDGTDYDDEDGTLVTGIGSWGDSLDDILDKIREWLDSQSPAGVIDPALEIAPEADIVDQLDPDLLSPENWPAIIPPLSLHDFSFNSIWHYVTDWIASFSGTLSTILGITFALPAVSIVYAVIVISLALWLIRRATQ